MDSRRWDAADTPVAGQEELAAAAGDPVDEVDVEELEPDPEPLELDPFETEAAEPAPSEPDLEEPDPSEPEDVLDASDSEEDELDPPLRPLP